MDSEVFHLAIIIFQHFCVLLRILPLKYQYQLGGSHSEFCGFIFIGGDSRVLNIWLTFCRTKKTFASGREIDNC